MSEVSICNQALGWVGADPIISLDDPSKTAALCKSNYGPLRDAVLQAHNWTFATARYQLPQASPAPVFGWANAFVLPSEVLRCWEVNKVDMDSPTREWQIEQVNANRAIVTDDAECRLKAIVRVRDTTLFSALFIQALAARIAADLAIPVTSSRTLQEDMFNLYLAKVKEAASLDGMQGKSRRVRSRWLNNARSTGGFGSAPPTV